MGRAFALCYNLQRVGVYKGGQEVGMLWLHQVFWLWVGINSPTGCLLGGSDGTRHYPLPGPFCMAHAVGEAVRLVPLSASRLSIQPLCAWRQTL